MRRCSLSPLGETGAQRRRPVLLFMARLAHCRTSEALAATPTVMLLRRMEAEYDAIHNQPPKRLSAFNWSE